MGAALELVQFEHTIFALPFAYAGAILAGRGLPPAAVVGWVTLAMVGARTCGMAANRLIDEPFDRQNPRTQGRPLIDGRISRRAAWAMSLGGGALLLAAASQLPFLCLILSPVALAILVLYSYLKRWTSLAHLGIGLVLAVAPVGGWLAVRGTIEAPPLILAGAVAAWVAGFDVLYALQDTAFDRDHQLHSVPADWGEPAARLVSRIAHLAALGLLVLLGLYLGLSAAYWAGLAGAAGLMIWEHRLVALEGLRRINLAFFVLNGWVSVLFLVAVLFSV